MAAWEGGELHLLGRSRMPRRAMSFQKLHILNKKQKTPMMAAVKASPSLIPTNRNVIVTKF